MKCSYLTHIKKKMQLQSVKWMQTVLYEEGEIFNGWVNYINEDLDVAISFIRFSETVIIN